MIQNRWSSAVDTTGDALDKIVHLSNIVGQDDRLVQPGGGNTSVKVERDGEPVLLVKGSGTDLRSIGRPGFTRLSMSRLAELASHAAMSDEAMMEFMRDCMLDGASDPLPSVETPLHSVLPYRAIAHTHDVATMSLTNVREGVATRIMEDLFEGEIIHVPYARPGFPLARMVMDLADSIPPSAHGLTLAHHGLIVWADDPRSCYERLLAAANRIEAFLEEKRRDRVVLGAPRFEPPSADVRKARAELLMPVIRGELGRETRVVLQWDDRPEVLARIGSERFGEACRRGMGTPEHILRAGCKPVWLDVDLNAADDALVAQARCALHEARADYLRYHARHAAASQRPLEDWAKIVLVPGLGMISAFMDVKSARVAGDCYRATMEAIENAEAIDRFTFLAEDQVFEFEHWPLERRKVEEKAAKEKSSLLLPRQVAVVLGGASGIGRAAVARFLKEGANVVVADLDQAAVDAICEELSRSHPDRLIGMGVDVRDEEAVAELFRRVVLGFGGLDTLFYTVGAPPRFAPVLQLEGADLRSQIEVHYIGAVLAIREAARVMSRQGTGGSVICSVSKAALAPGVDALAYGASKAALQQALRVAALELGAEGIRVNAINADQVDTPLFRSFVRERAASRGRSFEEQLDDYRRRNALGVSLIPPDAVADIAALLASERFRYTSGDILTVDGGLAEAFPR